MESRWLPPVLIVVLAGLLVWLGFILLGGDDEVSLTVGEPEVVSASQLESFAEDAGHPVYWLGEMPDSEYELTEAVTGRIYVRYLADDADAAAEDAEFLTVGTYPVDDAAAALRRTARQGDDREIARSGDGAVVLLDTDSPNNVHLAYPDEDLQIEIFSPVPGEALRLAAGDAAEPVS